MSSLDRGGSLREDGLNDTTAAAVARDDAVESVPFPSLRGWSDLEMAIDRLSRPGATGDSVKDLSYEHLYRTVYELVINSHGDELYSNLKHRTRQTIASVDKRLQDVALTTNFPLTLLSHYVEEAAQLWNFASVLSDVFLYMERKYCEPQQHYTVKELISDDFHRVLFNSAAREDKTFIEYGIEVSCDNLVPGNPPSPNYLSAAFTEVLGSLSDIIRRSEETIEQHEVQEFRREISLLKRVVKSMFLFAPKDKPDWLYKYVIEIPVLDYLRDRWSCPLLKRKREENTCSEESNDLSFEEQALLIQEVGTAKMSHSEPGQTYIKKVSD